MPYSKRLVLGFLCFVLSLTLQAQPPITGTWVQTAPMAEARRGASAALLSDGSVLITGGVGPDGLLATAELYANGSWSAAAPMAIPRSEHRSVTLADGRVLVIGGKSTGGQPTWTAEIYDPASDRWSSVGNMAKARAGHTASLLRD